MKVPGNWFSATIVGSLSTETRNVLPSLFAATMTLPTRIGLAQSDPARRICPRSCPSLGSAMPSTPARLMQAIELPQTRGLAIPQESFVDRQRGGASFAIDATAAIPSLGT